MTPTGYSRRTDVASPGDSARTIPFSRSQGSARAVATNLVFSLVTLSVGFVSVPLLLRWLGADRVGMYRVLLDSFAYLGLFGFGIDGALLACLAREIGRGNRGATAQVLAAGLKAYLPVSLVMVLGGGGLTFSLRHIFALGSVPQGELMFAGFIMAGNAFLIPFAVFRALAEAEQRSYLVKLLLTFQSILLTCLLLAAARLGWGLPGQMLATLLAQTPTIAILTVHGVRRYPGLRSVTVEPEVHAALWSLSWPTLFVAVCGQAALLSDNIVVGAFLGPLSVTAFFLTQRLASLAQAQLQGLGNASWAALVELHAQERHEVFRKRLLELTSLVSALSLATLGPIAVYTEHFIRLWVGPVYFAGFAVSCLASVNAWLWSLSSLWSWPVSGTGHVRRWLPYAVASAIVNLLISILATMQLGVMGPLLGTLAGFLLVHSWGLPRVLWEAFSLEPRQLLEHATAPMLWGVPYVGVLWYLTQEYPPAGWIALVTQTALAGSVGLALWWFLSLTGHDRRLWTTRLRMSLTW